MLVYAPIITPRIEYTFHYLIEKTGIHFELTESVDRYKNETTSKINYSIDVIGENDFHIIPCGLLSEKGVRNWEINVSQQYDLPIFFENGGSIGFDLPSAIFYLISRYEEYHAFTPDEYGRYPYQDSLAHKAEFLNQPIVDEWIRFFIQQFRTHFPDVKFVTPSFEFIPTYDIDIAWSYLHKGWLRNIGGFVKYPNTAIERLRVLAGIQKDPFDCYDELDQLHASNHHQPIYFFPVGKKRSSLDKHIDPDNTAYQSLIKSIAQKATIGLHPSIYSSQHPEALAEEKKTLEDIIGRSVNQSRQHYLRFTLPVTYRQLIEAGITDDYSMGYGKVNGFRASTSRSFLWYDLNREESTSLRIHPLVWMDANSYYEQKMNAEKATEEFLYYQKKIELVNGTFIAVSHNHLIAERSEWKNWSQQYHRLLKR